MVWFGCCCKETTERYSFKDQELLHFRLPVDGSMVVVGKCKCLWNFKVFISMNTATTTTHSAIDECTLITCRHRKILVPLSSPAENIPPSSSPFRHYLYLSSALGSVFGIRESSFKQHNDCRPFVSEGTDKGTNRVKSITSIAFLALIHVLREPGRITEIRQKPVAERPRPKTKTHLTSYFVVQGAATAATFFFWFLQSNGLPAGS